MLHAQPHALHVDVHQRVELGLAAIRQAAAFDLDAGVVEGVVEPAIGGQGTGHQRGDLGIAGHVAADEGRLAAGGTDRLDAGLAAPGVHVGHHDLDALAGESLGGGATDAGAGTGDQGDLAGKQLTHGTVLEGFWGSSPESSQHASAAKHYQDGDTPGIRMDDVGWHGTSPAWMIHSSAGGWNLPISVGGAMP
ncbi:hypothetical protein D9M73_206660 [compost metagenome]